MVDHGASEPRRQRVLVVGCGSMSRAWLRYLTSRDEIEVVGLVDIEPQAAAARAAEAGLEVPHFTELEAALAHSAPTVVCDVTIPEAHAGVAGAALRAGCHVASEKPMAHSVAAARATSALAAEAGLNYAIMQNRRYRPPIRAVRDIVASGELGEIGIVNADFYLGPHFGGFRDAMDSPLLLDMAIHTFDQARFITGSDPVAVYCHEFNPAWSWYAHGAAATAVFEMTGGLVFTYRGSWCSEALTTSWESQWRLLGGRGALGWDGEGQPQVELIGGGEVTTPAPYTGPEGHPGCLQEMFAAIAEGRPAETSYADNIQSLAMVFGAMESARRGERMVIAELLEP